MNIFSKEIDLDEKSQERVSLAHTHGAMGKNYFSDTQIDEFGEKYGDKYSARLTGLPIYLASPDGQLLKYDPKTNKTSVLTKDLPRNPEYPKSKKNKTPEVKNDDTRKILFIEGTKGYYGEKERK